MRSCIPLIMLLLTSVACRADKSLKSDNVAVELPSAKDLLRKASELAAEQDEAQHFWTMRLLLQVRELQIRAGDYDGARKSIRASADPEGLVHLAEGLAAAGRRQESLEVLRELGSNHGWRQEYLDDGVLLRWIEHLIAAGEIERAEHAAGQLKSEMYRPDAYRKLAVAYAKTGERSKSSHYFKLAVDAALETSGYDRAKALWETGEAQRSVGATHEARTTISLLLESADKMEIWAQVAALREAAVLFAHLADRKESRSLFQRAIASRQRLAAANKVGALELIAIAQSRVGYIDDALETVATIWHSESTVAQDGEREEALLAIAKAQLAMNNPDGAERTARSITHFLQFRDDSLHAVVEYYVQKKDFKKALTAAESVNNPSRMASAILKVATAYARSGDRKTAEEVASRIKLTSESSLPALYSDRIFDFRQPETWVQNYDIEFAFTLGLSQLSEERTAELAASAMTLAQTIPLEPKPDYAALLNDVWSDAVIQALARAHAATGDVAEALAWAHRIGSDRKVASAEDKEGARALQRRINALIGVAEGMLERSANGRTGPHADPPPL